MKEEEVKQEPCKCEVYSRVVGFYTPIQQWNDGKVEEYKKRKTFKIKEEAQRDWSK